MIKFYAFNLVDQSEISVGNENSLFPIENIKDYRRSKVFRSIGETTEIVFDLRETSEIDSVIIVPDKRSNFGFTSAKVDFSNTSDFSLPIKTEFLHIDFPEKFAILETELTEARFVRLTLDSTLDYCELANIFIGKKQEFESGMGIDLGWKFKNAELINKSTNRNGQVFSDKIARQKNLDFSITTMNIDELEIMTMITDSHGTIKPIYIHFDDGDLTRTPFRYSGMYKFDVIPDEVNKAFGFYDSNYSLSESM